LLRGHGELDSLQIASFNNSLLEQYDVFSASTFRKKQKIEGYPLLIVAKPRTEFSSSDKYKLDQYIMHGGKVLFSSWSGANMDSASREDYFAFLTA